MCHLVGWWKGRAYALVVIDNQDRRDHVAGILAAWLENRSSKRLPSPSVPVTESVALLSTASRRATLSPRPMPFALVVKHRWRICRGLENAQD